MILYYILLGIFVGAILVQLYFLLVYFRTFAFLKESTDIVSAERPISVIISARNERENLAKNLPFILSQEYSNYEVVVVNDCSYDGSSDLLKELKQKYGHLKVVEIVEDDRFKHGKKFALTLGIKASQHPYLLFTDADCIPESTQWIELMQQAFSEKELVLGYSPYKKYKGLLNAFIRFETFLTAIQYFSFALKQRAYMGVGRNLAYTKELFFKNKGFASHMHLLSGDDDLFVNHVATEINVAICLNPKSFVETEPKMSFNEYFTQKRRHLSTGRYYKREHILLLGLIGFSGILFYISFILLLFINFNTKFVLTLFAVKLIVQGIIYYPAMKKLKVSDLWWYYPFIDFFYFLIIPLWSITSILRKQRRWK